MKDIISHHTSHHITPHQITSHHITSHHITSHHIKSHHITAVNTAELTAELTAINRALIFPHTTTKSEPNQPTVTEPISAAELISVVTANQPADKRSIHATELTAEFATECAAQHASKHSTNNLTNAPTL